MTYLSPSMTFFVEPASARTSSAAAPISIRTSRNETSRRRSRRSSSTSVRRARPAAPTAVRARRPAQHRRRLVVDRQQGLRAPLRRLLPGSLEALVEGLDQGRVSASRTTGSSPQDRAEGARRAARRRRADQHRRRGVPSVGRRCRTSASPSTPGSWGVFRGTAQPRLRVARPGRRRRHVARALRARDRRRPRESRAPAPTLNQIAAGRVSARARTSAARPTAASTTAAPT